MSSTKSLSPSPSLQLSVVDPLAAHVLENVLQEVELTPEQCKGTLDESLIDSLIDEVASAFCEASDSLDQAAVRTWLANPTHGIQFHMEVLDPRGTRLLSRRTVSRAGRDLKALLDTNVPYVTVSLVFAHHRFTEEGLCQLGSTDFASTMQDMFKQYSGLTVPLNKSTHSSSSRSYHSTHSQGQRFSTTSAKDRREPSSSRGLQQVPGSITVGQQLESAAQDKVANEFEPIAEEEAVESHSSHASVGADENDRHKKDEDSTGNDSGLDGFLASFLASDNPVAKGFGELLQKSMHQSSRHNSGGEQADPSSNSGNRLAGNDLPYTQVDAANINATDRVHVGASVIYLTNEDGPQVARIMEIRATTGSSPTYTFGVSYGPGKNYLVEDASRLKILNNDSARDHFGSGSGQHPLGQQNQRHNQASTPRKKQTPNKYGAVLPTYSRNPKTMFMHAKSPSTASMPSPDSEIPLEPFDFSGEQNHPAFPDEPYIKDMHIDAEGSILSFETSTGRKIIPEVHQTRMTVIPKFPKDASQHDVYLWYCQVVSIAHGAGVYVPDFREYHQEHRRGLNVEALFPSALHPMLQKHSSILYNLLQSKGLDTDDSKHRSLATNRDCCGYTSLYQLLKGCHPNLGYHAQKISNKFQPKAPTESLDALARRHEYHVICAELEFPHRGPWSLEEIAENYIASLGDGNKALETFVLGKYRHDQGSNDPDIDILYADQTTMYQTLNDYCSLPQAPSMSDDSVPSIPTPVSASKSSPWKSSKNQKSALIHSIESSPSLKMLIASLQSSQPTDIQLIMQQDLEDDFAAFEAEFEAHDRNVLRAHVHSLAADHPTAASALDPSAPCVYCQKHKDTGSCNALASQLRRNKLLDDPTLTARLQQYLTSKVHAVHLADAQPRPKSSDFGEGGH